MKKAGWLLILGGLFVLPGSVSAQEREPLGRLKDGQGPTNVLVDHGCSVYWLAQAVKDTPGLNPTQFRNLDPGYSIYIDVPCAHVAPPIMVVEASREMLRIDSMKEVIQASEKVPAQVTVPKASVLETINFQAEITPQKEEAAKSLYVQLLEAEKKKSDTRVAEVQAELRKIQAELNEKNKHQLSFLAGGLWTIGALIVGILLGSVFMRLRWVRSMNGKYPKYEVWTVSYLDEQGYEVTGDFKLISSEPKNDGSGLTEAIYECRECKGKISCASQTGECQRSLHIHLKDYCSVQLGKRSVWGPRPVRRVS